MISILLDENNVIYTVSNDIEKVEEYKWALMNEDGEIFAYIYDDAHDLRIIKDVTLPSDYVEGKYFYIDGEFVLNEDWKPYKSPEERLTELEELNQSLQEQNDMLLECLLEMSEIVYGG